MPGAAAAASEIFIEPPVTISPFAVIAPAPVMSPPVIVNVPSLIDSKVTPTKVLVPGECISPKNELAVEYIESA